MVLQPQKRMTNALTQGMKITLFSMIVRDRPLILRRKKKLPKPPPHDTKVLLQTDPKVTDGFFSSPSRTL